MRLRQLSCIHASVLTFLLMGSASCVSPSDPVASGESGSETEGEEGSGDPLSTCDPLIQDCGAGLACALVGQHFECTTEGSSDFGENCTYPDDCSAGLVCANFSFDGCDSGFGCCTAFCEPGDNDCGSGFDCVSLFDGAPPPGVGPVGVCAPVPG